MLWNDFEYERPNSLERAVDLLKEGGTVRALAGGTDLLPNLRVGVTAADRIVSLQGLIPQAPRMASDGAVVVDAMSRLVELERSPLLAGHWPMLTEAARAVGSQQIREMGTLGGNLCQETRCLYFNQPHDFQFVEPCYKRAGHCCYPFPGNDADTCWSVYMSDLAPALIALQANLEILGPEGLRTCPVEELFTGRGLQPLALAKGELIRRVVVPQASPGSGWGFHKSTVRGGLEFGMVVIAVMLRMEADGRTCAEARIVFGAIGEGPVRPVATERWLVGTDLDAAAAAEAAAAAAREVRPVPHHGFTKSHLRHNIQVNLQRTLSAALERSSKAAAG